MKFELKIQVHASQPNLQGEYISKNDLAFLDIYSSEFTSKLTSYTIFSLYFWISTKAVWVRVMSHRYHKKEKDFGAEKASKFKFKYKNCALQISANQFLGEIFEKVEISI